MKRLNFGLVLVLAFVFTLSVSNVLAQDMCVGDFDYDGDCDGTDAARFKQDFGRSIFKNPCPPDGPAKLPKTGQTTSYATGDDGDLEKGVAWPNPRFTDNLDGTVTDNLTGLIWLKDANCIATNYPGFDNVAMAGDGMVRWQHALDFVAGINDGTYPDCGAGSTDWRLPNKNELASLLHYEYYNSAVPNTAGTGQWSEGDPFNNMHYGGHWSSTTHADNAGYAWGVGMNGGYINYGIKDGNSYCVWPVRGGQ